MSFLYALIKPVSLRGTRDNSPFFPLSASSGLEAESPLAGVRSRFQRTVRSNGRGAGKYRERDRGGRGREREHLLFPRLTYKVRFAHACMAARRRNNRLENCCRFVAHSSTRVSRRAGRNFGIELRTTGNWWRYLKLANDHFVNLLILPPFQSRCSRSHAGVPSLSAVSASEN